MSLCSSIAEDLKIRIRNLTAAMVKEKGPEHAHVVQQEEPKTPGESTKVKCKYCCLHHHSNQDSCISSRVDWIWCASL